MGEMRLQRNLNAKHLAIVLLTTVVIRGGFFFWSWSEWYFFMPQHTLSEIYFKEGYAIAAGYGYVLGESPKGVAVLDELYRRVDSGEIRALTESATPLAKDDVRPEMLHPPGMSFLVASIHRVFGIRADVPLQIFGIVLDTASAGLFWWIVTTFFGMHVALMAGLLYAVFPPFAYAAVSKMPDGMLNLFLIGCIACTLKATGERKWKWVMWTVIAGVCIGLGAYLRPDYLLVPAVIFVGLWAHTRRFWHSALAAVMIQVVAVLLLLPWAYRNYSVCGRWIFTSTSVGGTLVTGLGEFHNPWAFGGSDEDRYIQARGQGISSPWSCEGDRYFRDLFLESVRQDPAAYAIAVVRRLPLALATPYGFGFQNPWKTIKFSEALQRGEDRYTVLVRRPWYVLVAYWEYLLIAGFTLVCLLSTLVMFLKERSKAGLILLIVSPHLYAVGSHLLTHFQPRFVLPSTFGLLVGVAYVLSRKLEPKASSLQM